MTADESRTIVAALDYGMSRIGLAVSDELGLLAHPRPFVLARPPARALRFLAKSLEDEGVGHVLVGLPLNMDGSEGKSARRARDFAAEVAKATGLVPELVDERLSTVSAQALLRQAGQTARTSKTLIDSASAAVLLQAWLDGRRPA